MLEERNESIVQLPGFNHFKTAETSESISFCGSKSSMFTSMVLQSITMYDLPL